MPRVYGKYRAIGGRQVETLRSQFFACIQKTLSGGKGHDVHTGMTHNIVARQECDISVSHLYKWALRVVNR